MFSGSAVVREQENNFPAYKQDGADDQLPHLNDETTELVSKTKWNIFMATVYVLISW